MLLVYDTAQTPYPTNGGIQGPCIVDDDIIWIGSYNLVIRAMVQNMEPSTQ